MMDDAQMQEYHIIIISVHVNNTNYSFAIVPPLKRTLNFFGFFG